MPSAPPTIFTPPSAATPPAADVIFSPPAAATPPAADVIFTPPAAATPPAADVIFSPPAAATPPAADVIFSPPSAATPAAADVIFSPPSAATPSAAGEVFTPAEASAPSAPLAMFEPPEAEEPDAPGAVHEAPLTMPWDGGILIAGDLEPDATGALLPAGLLDGVAAWSTDGETTPPVSGRWTIHRWVAYAEIVIWSYLDGEMDAAWASSDGGSDALPTIDILEAGNWFSAYELFASGTPDVRLTGAMIAPGAAFVPSEAGAPSAPLTVFSAPVVEALPGVFVGGVISPDVTGYLAPASDYEGSASYTSDGEDEAPVSGRWAILRFDPYSGISLTSWNDGMEEAAWVSEDAGADELPSMDIRLAGNFVVSYMSTGVPVLQSAVGPAVAFVTPATASPSAPLTVFSAPAAASPSAPLTVYDPPAALAWTGGLTVSGDLSVAIHGNLLAAPGHANLYPGGSEWTTTGLDAAAVSGAWARLYQAYLITPEERTLAEIAPVANYTASASQSTASSITRNNTTLTGVVLYWLYNNGGGTPYWTRTGGGLANEDATVIPAGAALFPRTRLGDTTFIGGDGHAWETSGVVEWLWVCLPYVNGSGSGLGYWIGVGVSPAGASWAPAAGAAGTLIINLTGAELKPGAVFQAPATVVNPSAPPAITT